MKVFRMTNAEQGDERFPPVYSGTLGEAKVAAHETAQALRPEFIVEELEVQADKAGVVAMLNAQPIVTATIRAWGITPRGALKEEKT